MKRNFSHGPNEHPFARVAAYESLLDLFTLISFILILGAFTYVARSNRAADNSASVTAAVTTTQGDAPATLPKDVGLLIFYKERLVNKVAVLDGVYGTSTNFSVNSSDLEKTLEQIFTKLARARKVDLAVPSDKDQRDATIVLQAQEWLTHKAITNWTIVFY